MKPVEALQAICKHTVALQSTVNALPTEPENEGISLLQAKSATLLRYNANLIRLALSKLQGNEIGIHAEKLAQDWAAMEKMRPLERKLRHQIDTLLKPATTEAERHRPNAAAIEVSDDETGVYRPPRLSEVTMDANMERERAVREKVLKRRMRNERVREMLDEVKGRPEEIGRREGRVERMMKEEEGRQKYEEEYMTRLNVSKKDRKRRRKLEDVALDDELGELEEIANRLGEKKVSSGRKRRKS